MYDVICVGSATVDVFVDTDSELISIKDKDHKEELIAYPAGTKMLIKDLQFTIGGGGTNTSVSFARLGLKTGYVGCLGNDENSDRVLSMLKKENIDFLGERMDGQGGYSVILDSIEHDRTILTYKGTNTKFNFDGLDKEKLNAKWFYFTSFIGEAYHQLEKLAEYAVSKNIKIAFNPSSYLAKKGKDFLANLLSKSEALILNREEAEYLVGHGEITSTLRSLAAMGPKIVAVTEGNQPVHVLYEQKIYKITPRKIAVVESTGAGDAFGSSFIAGLILKNDIDYALKLALADSESVISRHGAKEKLLTLQEAEDIMKKEGLVVESLPL